MIALLILQLALPNATTPGLVRGLDVKTICATKWGADHRHVTPAMKRQVLKNYGIRIVVARGKGPCCEIDHRVPRELGGADDVANLWPQPWVEATKKDAEENKYHKDVCDGSISLTAAQMYFMHWGEK